MPFARFRTVLEQTKSLRGQLFTVLRLGSLDMKDYALTLMPSLSLLSDTVQTQPLVRRR